MTHKTMSNLTHKDLSYFQHLELKINTLADYADKLSREQLTIPEELLSAITPIISDLLPSSEQAIRTLVDLLHFLRIILNFFSVTSREQQKLSALVNALDDVVQYFASKTR